MSLGLTVACKVSGALVAVPVLLGLLGETALDRSRRVGALEGYSPRVRSGADDPLRRLCRLSRSLALCVRQLELVDLRINQAFRDALAQQQDAVAGKSCIRPRTNGCSHRELWDPLKNLVTWQLGLPLGIAALAGLLAMSVAFLRP